MAAYSRDCNYENFAPLGKDAIDTWQSDSYQNHHSCHENPFVDTATTSQITDHEPKYDDSLGPGTLPGSGWDAPSLAPQNDSRSINHGTMEHLSYMSVGVFGGPSRPSPRHEYFSAEPQVVMQQMAEIPRSVIRNKRAVRENKGHADQTSRR